MLRPHAKIGTWTTSQNATFRQNVSAKFYRFISYALPKVEKMLVQNFMVLSHMLCLKLNSPERSS